METKRFKHIWFSEYTQTYRTHPENYWIASVKDNELVFDSWDGAIKEYSFKSHVEKLHKQIKVCRNTHKRLHKTNNLIPVIVKGKNSGLGVQFWTDWQINNRVSTNTDRTESLFISLL